MRTTSALLKGLNSRHPAFILTAPLIEPRTFSVSYDSFYSAF
uniref:Uncharacterized protein n=1 Tax=Parascaris equorum TaxID=6256 RepID=A0A914RM28_PAREQ